MTEVGGVWCEIHTRGQRCIGDVLRGLIVLRFAGRLYFLGKV